MPGIYGYSAANTRAVCTHRLSEMSGRMMHHAWYRNETCVAPGRQAAMGIVSLGFTRPGAQTACTADGSASCVLHGELYEVSGQHARTPFVRALEDETHAQTLLRGYLTDGAAYACRVEGKFSAAIWDGNRQRLIMVTDPFGIMPLYYCHLPGRIVFGSEIKALLADSAVPRACNVEALSRFFSFGHLFLEDTLLQAVSLAPAAAWIEYDVREDKTFVKRYWQPRRTDPAPHTREPELLDRAADALQSAVDRRLHGPRSLGIALSGGLDARTILALIDHGTTPVKSVTLGVDGSLDLLSAARLSELTNRDHHPLILGKGFLDGFESHMRRMVYLTDGQYRDQCIVMPTLALYRELGIEVLLRGHAGELMHMDKAYTYSVDREALALPTDDERPLHDWLLRRLSASMVDNVPGPLLTGVSRERQHEIAHETISTCLKDSADVKPQLRRVPHMFLAQRVRRECGLSLALFGSVVETRVPYLDKDLVELLLAMPHAIKLGDRIQRHILRRVRPEFLQVRNANTGATLGASTVTNRLATMRMRVLRKLGFRGYQPYERLGPWLQKELNPCVRKLLLAERCLSRGVLAPDTVRHVVEQHTAGTANHTYLLISMMIVETSQRLFTDGENIQEVAA
jgi:asparagine synthase (glutamine-hydrolysing)